ncbi:MAG: glycerophosphodiester phosphodiesterase family protein [Microbacteriaceae bacterium]
MEHAKDVTKYWDSPLPRIFAHRGLGLQHPENSLEAFQHALAFDTGYLETDIQASADGIAVVTHDADFRHLAGISRRVNSMNWDEIDQIRLAQGERILSLEDLLEALPHARLNIDVKDAGAIADTARAIQRAAAQHRVLISSFSTKRRLKTLQALSALGYSGTVATSAASAEVLLALLGAKLHLLWLMKFALRRVDAVQIPVSILRIRLDSAAMIHAFHRACVEVHFWTINDTKQMSALLANGADGIVTDRCDLAMKLIQKPNRE